MSIAPAIRERLSAAGTGADGALLLGAGALALSAAVRELKDTEVHDRHLQALADGVAGYVRGAEDTLDLRAEALARILGAHYGYGVDKVADGEGVDDDGQPEFACLIGAIEHRHATALVLGILYLTTARALGWDAEGLDFPGRFLVRLDLGPQRRILSPLDGGHTLDAPALRALLKAAAGNDAELTPTHYRAMENRAILYRYQSEMKMRLLRAGRLEEALYAVEAMLLAQPLAAGLWREAGLIHARLDNVSAAVVALERFIEIADEEDARYKASQLITELRSRLP